MRALPLLALVVVVACAAGAPSLEDDLRAIEVLNQGDIDAVMSSDVDAMISQWTEDFVFIPQEGPIVRGRDAMIEVVEPARAMADLVEPVEHVLDFEEVIVAGDYAIQWGTFSSTSRSRENGE